MLTGLDTYHLLPAATAYRRALDLVGNEPECAFLARHLALLPDLYSRHGDISGPSDGR